MVIMIGTVHWKGALLALSLLLLPSISYGISCTSRYYCVTPEVKYISMEHIPHSYLNATAIKTHKVKNVSQCQKVCIREDKCQSINLNVNKIEGYNCHLLSANKYSNSSLLVKDTTFIHLYIPSKCEGDTCRNGGICVPTYNNDSYFCECKSNGSWISRGKHCENVVNGYRSAFIYYSFNDMAKRAPLNKDNMPMTSYGIIWKGTRVTDRTSPVGWCKRGGPSCMQIWNGLPCVNSFTSCTSAVTYSIWLRFGQSQVGQYTEIIRKYPGDYTGIYFVYSNGNGYRFSCSISASRSWSITDFGKRVNQLKWNQFTFSIDDSKMACAYINGVKEMCQTVPTSVSNIISTNLVTRVGGYWYPGSEPMMYFDDFGIWRIALTEDDVVNLYYSSKD